MKFDDVRVGDVFFNAHDGETKFTITYKSNCKIGALYANGFPEHHWFDWWDSNSDKFQLICHNECVIVMVGDAEDYEDARLSKLTEDRLIKPINWHSHEEAWKKQHKRQVMTAHKEWK